jgi:hypothetical protein
MKEYWKLQDRSTKAPIKANPSELQQISQKKAWKEVGHKMTYFKHWKRITASPDYSTQ